MRSLVLLVIGLLVGAAAGYKAMEAIAARHSLPRATMNMTRFHFSRVYQATKAGQCDDPSNRDHADAMASIARTLEPVFLPPDGEPDPVFKKNIGDLQDAISGLSASIGQGCDVVNAARQKVADACQQCHKDYR